MLGRLSLNPLRHIDPVGTVLVPGVLLALGAPIIGWARPVPVAVSALRSPRRGMILVALAGPAANILMALVWCVVLAGAARSHFSGLSGLLGACSQAPPLKLPEVATAESFKEAALWQPAQPGDTLPRQSW